MYIKFKVKYLSNLDCYFRYASIVISKILQNCDTHTSTPKLIMQIDFICRKKLLFHPILLKPFCLHLICCVVGIEFCYLPGQHATLLINMSHFSYACKMRYPLNLVLENWEYLWFYRTFLHCNFRLWFKTP